MTQLINQIEINCSAPQLFEYVTQPWLWHEWHPNSVSAVRQSQPLKQGDCFEEQICLKPFGIIPFTIKRNSRYTVLSTVPHRLWVVEGKMKNGVIQIKYEFEPLSEHQVCFKRTLSIETKGSYKALHFILARYLRKTSHIAVRNLKKRVEQGLS